MDVGKTTKRMKHRRYQDGQIIWEREKFIEGVEEKCKSKRISEAIKPSDHSSSERKFRNHKKSQSENFENRKEVINKQSVQSKERKEPRKLGHDNWKFTAIKEGISIEIWIRIIMNLQFVTKG